MNQPYSELFRTSTMTLCTTGPDGEPHVAPVYFIAIQPSSPEPQAALKLCFFSDIKSQHAQDISRDPRAAAALYPECLDWQDIRGLQMHGAVHPVDTGPEWQQAWELYRLKFPFVTHLKAVVARNTLFAFIPHWIRMVDNRRGFGFKQEWMLSSSND